MLHRISLAGARDGWVSCFAGIPGSRYKILNAR